MQTDSTWHGGARTIAADGSRSTYLTGVISDSVGGGSLTKTGTSTLYLQGSSGNTYTGTTTITAGKVYLNQSSGFAIPGNLTISTDPDVPGLWTAVSPTYVIAQGAGQISPSCLLSFVNYTVGNFSRFELYGHATTLAGLSGIGVVENTESEHFIGNSTLTINNSTDCWFAGYLRNNGGGSGAITAVTKTGTGSQTLAGDGIQYTGSTTISQGTLVFQDITNASLLARTVTNNGTLGLSAVNTAFTFTGVISGTGSLSVTGGNWVTLGGSSANTFSGTTTITEGHLMLAKTPGVNAITGDVTLVNDAAFLVVKNPNQFPATTKVTFAGTYNPHFEVYGNTVTVGGIFCTGGGEIENTEWDTGVGNGTLVVNNSTDCWYSGTIRDTAGGSGNIAIVKDGPGTLTFTGGDVGSYTGGLTVNAGTLDYSGGTLPNCNYTITGGSPNIGSRMASIKTFQITGGAVKRHHGQVDEQHRLRRSSRNSRRHLGGHEHRPEQDDRRNRSPHRQQHLHRRHHHLRWHSATRRRRLFRLLVGQCRRQPGHDVRRQSLLRHADVLQQDQRHGHAYQGRSGRADLVRLQQFLGQSRRQQWHA